METKKIKRCGLCIEKIKVSNSSGYTWNPNVHLDGIFMQECLDCKTILVWGSDGKFPNGCRVKKTLINKTDPEYIIWKLK